jgi:hypothetical protein
MAFWVRETGIDGFRAELDKIKPMFMLAEAAQLDLHQQAIDMTYGGDTLEPLKDVAMGKADPVPEGVVIGGRLIARFAQLGPTREREHPEHHDVDQRDQH